MADYIDGFVFPIREEHLQEYKAVAEKVAVIWKEYGALSYQEFVGDDLNTEGTRPFGEMVDALEGECIVFGWVTFATKERRDQCFRAISEDRRMLELVAPLMDPARKVFDPMRMAYAGFKPLIHL